MIEALIFDLDGLLADTESIHYEAYREVLQEYGIILTKNNFIENWTKNGKGIKDFLKNIGSEQNADMLRKMKAMKFKEIAKHRIKEMQGATPLLLRCHNKYKMALATSSNRDTADMVLNALKVQGYFDIVLTRSDTLHPKPSPDIFIKAANLLGSNKSKCLVFEDSPKGIGAAIAAGMQVIAVPNEYTIDFDFSDATLVVNSLDDVSSELLSQL